MAYVLSVRSVFVMMLLVTVILWDGLRYVCSENLLYVCVCVCVCAFIDTRLIGRSDRISSRASTPVLLTSSGGCVCDSTDIMSYVSGKYSTSATSLYPTAKVRDLVRLYSSRLGPRTRRIAYYYILQDVKLFVRLSKLNCGPRQATLIKRLFSLGSSYLRNSLGVSKTHVTRDMKYVCEEFDSVSAMLSDGRKYLTHNRFTAADLTFACMAAPVLMVTVEEGYGGRLPYMHEMTHPALKQFVKQIKTLRQTPAGKFALRMFREERGTRILPCYPLLTPMSKL